MQRIQSGNGLLVSDADSPTVVPRCKDNGERKSFVKTTSEEFTECDDHQKRTANRRSWERSNVVKGSEDCFNSIRSF